MTRKLKHYFLAHTVRAVSDRPLARVLQSKEAIGQIAQDASIHLVNVSIVTYKHLNPLGVLSKTPTVSIPQIVKDQERSIVRRGFTCFIVCF
jgi:hypothetical protein